jgi:hypothetical protein
LKKSTWTDDELKNLLRNLPTITDKRTPDEIYRKVQLKQERKKRKLNWIPLATAAVALFLLSILGASWIKESNNSSSSESSSDQSISDIYRSNKEDNTEQSKIQEENHVASEAKDSSNQEMTSDVQLAPVYSYDDESESLVTVALPDKRNVNYTVPITLIVDKFADKDRGEEMVDAIKTINEDMLGLSEFRLDARITSGESSKTVNIDFPENSLLLTNDTMFFQLIHASLKFQDIERITYTTDGKEGATFSHGGYLTEEMIDKQENRTYYLYQYNQTTPAWLVPSTENYNTITEALEAAKNVQSGDGIYPSISDQVSWIDINEDNETLSIIFDDRNGLTDSDVTLRALEAILFTAKDFGYRAVKFENTGIDAVGPLNLTEPVLVPVAPNKIN